jgi:hypothetical protein
MEGFMHTGLAHSQDGSHVREEEANLSAILAVRERGGGGEILICNPLPLGIQAIWYRGREVLRG